MELEKIIIARNNMPEGSPTEYLGAEISIGELSLDKINEFKELLNSDNLFEEMSGEYGAPYIGSSYLTDLMDIHELYHKNGLIYYENLNDNGGDIYSYSTDNWVFIPPENENFDPNPDFKSPHIVKIKNEGFIVLSIRTLDLYFKARGEFAGEYKQIFNDTGIAKFGVQTGVDNFHSIMFEHGFSGFNLLHSVYINGVELLRDEDEEGEAENIYYSSHLIFHNGKLLAWLASNNHSHTFPFDYMDADMSCISPYLKENEPEKYRTSVKKILDKFNM